MTNDEPSNPGEVREDIPLRPSDSSGFTHKIGGIRLIIASFAFLSVAVTIALAVQIYKGDYEVVPHGSVATDSKECSSIGTNILKSGGNSVDAAIAAAFCLAVVNVHTTGLDATGTLMYYDYRQSRNIIFSPSPPIVIDFSDRGPTKYPRLVEGLAFLHDKFGSLEWNELVMPAVKLASNGFNAPTTLIEATHTVGNTNMFKDVAPGNNISFPSLAAYLNKIAQANSSVFVPDITDSSVIMTEAISFDLGDFTIYAPPIPSAYRLQQFLNATYVSSQNRRDQNGIDAIYRNVHYLNLTMPPVSGPASTVAVIDKDEIYVSMISGLRSLLGSQNFTSDGFIQNTPLAENAPSDNTFLPTIITSSFTCGIRVVLSCGDPSGAGQVINTLLQNNDAPIQLATALESPRLQKINDKYMAYEKSHTQVYKDVVLENLVRYIPLTAAPQPYPTCNAVQQIGDGLSSHADSRGGGLASRF